MNLLQQSRNIVNPPYNASNILTIAGALFILFAIPLTVISVNKARDLASRAQQEAGETIVETNIGAGELDFKGRMSQFGDVSVLIHRKDSLFEWWAYFKDSSDNTSNVKLPGFSGSSPYWGGEYTLTSSNELVVFSGGGPITARTYQLTGSPLPTSASLASSRTFGNSNSRSGSFTKLSSGALVGVWYQLTANSDNSIDYGVAYRNPAGVWSTIFPLNVEGTQGNLTSPRMSVAQHPSDNSIWFFSKRDSYHQIEAIHLSESGSGISLDWVDNDFIGEANGNDGPEGEHPDIQAVSDPTRNSLLLAYQSKEFKRFSTSPFVKGAYVRIAKIAANKNTTFIPFNTYVERVLSLGLVAQSDKIWLAYRPIDENDLTFDDIYISSHDGASWSNPQLLGTLSHNNNIVAFGADKPIFAIQETDDNVHYFEVTSGGKTGDLNGDGKVNIIDLSIFLNYWGTTDPTADFNNDGIVNILDISILLTYWGT
jgi:hypothetical protein